ncbi:MAG: MaoC family dehydratase N-terminal domain-containing protein [Comamonadaceae bacterium]|nr:MaoC family dehydratase N-terminal domain-containing protein [Pseudomonadota bacterium]MBS0608053.1 MaoC family dehydratase N-terminal domain-containing protein [Pseudomonadota bacterium]MDE2413406.1 MaoC family dehydratase N-terminal domain-containing protein [Comamonadaceae bacterium]
MSEVDTLPEAARRMIGVPLYEERTEFPIEIGYVYNACAAVENGNPLFWDAEAAQEIVGGRIAPPTMMSVWFRPHRWAPGATGERKALKAHFDLKELLDLPEAVVANNEASFGEPVRMGDTLTTCQVVRSIGPIKQTRLGIGRFWTIDVRTTNQRGEWVGTEAYTLLGYRRPEQ